MPASERNPFISFAARVVPVSEKGPSTEAKRFAQERRLLAELAPLKAKHDVWKSGKGVSPTVEEYNKITRLAKKILDVRNGRSTAETESISPLTERISGLALDLSTKLSDRFSLFGKSESFSISTPELPEGLTQEHLDTINEVLGGKLEERILPTLEDLHSLDESYVDVMYPAAQSEDDTKNGLISYRPSFWNNSASATGYTFTDHPTWGEALLHSMRLQLQDIGGSLVLLDTAIKPGYHSGLQGYGTVEGIDKTADPFLSLFQEAFGPTTNRFKHSYSEIQKKLLPLVKKKITDALKEKGLSEVTFEVILVPATLENIDLTFHHPESSTTDTWEWTSTILKDDDDKEAGRALLAGGSGFGGAAHVDVGGVAGSGGNWGARLAVVLNATEH